MNRKTQLDGLRALLFFAIFGFHYMPQRLPTGHYALPVFYVLSGFLITNVLLSLERLPPGERLRTFYLRRSLRILPAYFVCVIPLMILGRVGYPFSAATLWLNVRMFASSLGGAPYQDLPGSAVRQNLHLWSVSVEEQFYLIYPFVLYVAGRSHRTTVLLIGVVLSVVCRVLLMVYWPQTFYSCLLPVPMEYFLWGSLFAWWGSRRSLRWLRPGWTLPASIVVMFGAIWVEHSISPLPWGQLQTSHLQTLLAPCLGLLVWSLSEVEDAHPLSRLARWKPLVRVGQMSYFMYLIHLVAGVIYWKLTPATPFARGIGPAMAGSFAITLLLAVIVKRLIEEPIDRMRYSIGATPPATDRTDWASCPQSST